MLNVWAICENDSTAKAMVRPITGSAGSASKNARPKEYASSVNAPIRHPSTAIRQPIPPENRLSPRRAGGRRITPGSIGSTPSARAGTESVTRLTHSSWIARSGDGRPIRKPAKTVRISPMLHDSRKCTVLRMFAYTPRPSRTAATMVVKLSSASTMSAAPLATSVPPRPMAQPMSAARRAGASLIPSPVMAATSPFAWKARTMRTLCSGETRANTSQLRTAFLSSASLSSSSCAPVSTCPESVRMPSSRAMADAVAAWSPVIITGRIPAARHWATASRTPARGGSVSPISPAKVRFRSSSLSGPRESVSRYATPITRSPAEAMASFFERNDPQPPAQYRARTSGAPLQMIR